jgi:hypothetical protein
MASSGILRRVAVVRTYFLEELSAFFIRGTRIGELGTTLADISNRRTLRRAVSAVHISQPAVTFLIRVSSRPSSLDP